MTPDAILERNNQSYFNNDEEEDLAVELFTKNNPLEIKNKDSTVFVAHTTGDKLLETESQEIIDFICNYTKNVGGEVVYLNNSVAYKSYVIFPSDKIVTRTINVKVPKDAPFSDDLINIVYKFFNSKDYTIKRYNSRHNIE